MEIVRKPELEEIVRKPERWEIALRPELEVELEVRKLGSTPLRCWKFAERRAKLEERRGESGGVMEGGPKRFRRAQLLHLLRKA